MGLAAVLGQNYKLPQEAQELQPQGVEALDTGMASLPSQALADVDGSLQSYYEKQGQLEAFAQGLWKNKNIDVTKPDYRNPVAMRAHQVYLKAIADLRYQGNNLQNQQKELQKVSAAGLTNHGADIQDHGDGTFTNTGQTDDQKTAVDQANRIELANLNNAARARDNEARIKAASNKLEAKTAQDAKKYDGFKKDIADIGNALTGGGNWYSGREPLADGSGNYLQNDLWEGQKYGKGANGKDRIIEGMLFNPDTGEQKLLFKDRDNHEPEIVTIDDLETMINNKVGSGPSGVSAKNALKTYLNSLYEQGISLAPEQADITEAQEVFTANNALIKQTQDDLLASIEDIGRWGSVDFTLPNGTILQLGKKIAGNNKVQIENAKALWGDNVGSLGDYMSPKELIALLSRFNAFGFDKPSTINADDKAPATGVVAPVGTKDPFATN